MFLECPRQDLNLRPFRTTEMLYPAELRGRELNRSYY